MNSIKGIMSFGFIYILTFIYFYDLLQPSLDYVQYTYKFVTRSIHRGIGYDMFYPFHCLKSQIRK